MKITKRQLKRIIREAEGSTKKYDDDSALKGKQSTLPDALQKGIIDKTVEDRDEQEEADDEVIDEHNMRITKRQLRRIVKEALTGTSVLSKKPYLSLVKNAIAAGDPQSAASSVMDSYFIDDVWQEEEDALVDALGALSYDASEFEIENAADLWFDNYRSGQYHS